MNVLTTTFSPSVPRKDRTDAYMASRSILERITQKSEHNWSLEAYLVPSGTATTPPDCGDLLTNALGTETIGGSDVTYSLASTQALTLASIVRHWDGIFMEAMAGAWVDEVTLTFAGGDEPKISASGGAMDYAATGYTTTNGALSGGESSFTATNGAVFHNPASTSIYAQSVITVCSSTDHVVTSVSGTTVNVTPNIVGAQGNGSDVVPYAPTHTDAGSPVAGISGSVTLGGAVSLVVTGATVTIRNNIKRLADHALTPHTDDIVPMFREVMITLSCRLRQDFIASLLQREQFSTASIQIIAGDTAGSRWQIDAPAGELDYSDISVPEAEEATVDFPIRCLGSSGNDEITIKHT
jgi:hypothetical protein